MADNRQFGSPKAPQFGDKISPGGALGESRHCTECEAMLADALDGTLSAAEQLTFDTHTAHCAPCAQMLADARRGAAWLEMLRDPRPEPPAALLERILSLTSGAKASDLAGTSPGAGIHAVPPLQPALTAAFVTASTSIPGNILPFRRRVASAVRGNALGQLMLQPRLAMTAAMAFFSIALTLNLTGVRVQDFRASDLRPASVKRSFYSANARVVQYYEGLRVVYELESRVRELQSVSDTDTRTIPTAAPQSPAADPTSTPQADPKKPQPALRKSGPGTSQRDILAPARMQLTAAARSGRTAPERRLA